MRLKRRSTNPGTKPSSSCEQVILFANPSSDVYGSDLQMLESISSMVETGFKVVVTTPDRGPLVDLIEQRGATVLYVRYPVVRRENASALGLCKLMVAVLAALPAIRQTIKNTTPDLVYINTVTIPWWILMCRIMRTPSVCHVHEAEQQDSRIVRMALAAPLVLADRLVVISRASMAALLVPVPRLRKKMVLIYNGVPDLSHEPHPFVRGDGPRRIALIGRLSPRKGTDVALDAVGLLRESGRDVTLEVCGTPFAGYEWFAELLHARADKCDLKGSVTFSGYVRPVWPVLARAEVVLAPSLREPFGNAVVEAQLACRPVVAAAALGHLETIEDGRTGLLVTPQDPVALATALEKLLDDDDLARDIALNGRQSALKQFSIDRYRKDIAKVVHEGIRSRKP